jgi:hypothetical protein
MCRHVQTNKHVLSNCSAPSALKRYKLRHDAVLFILCNWLRSVLKDGATLYADIAGFQPLEIIFKNLRPDIAVVYNNTVYLCELTVCHETNLTKSRDYKRAKYANISRNVTTNFIDYSVDLHTIELSVLGFISDCSSFIKSVSYVLLTDDIYASIVRNVIGNSYNIYLNRNNDS